MQERSHQVVENAGSGLGSFSKRTHFPAGRSPSTEGLQGRAELEYWRLPIANCQLGVAHHRVSNFNSRISIFEFSISIFGFPVSIPRFLGRGPDCGSKLLARFVVSGRMADLPPRLGQTPGREEAGRPRSSILRSRLNSKYNEL
jgi:hypothetical protein